MERNRLFEEILRESIEDTLSIMDESSGIEDFLEAGNFTREEGARFIEDCKPYYLRAIKEMEENPDNWDEDGFFCGDDDYFDEEIFGKNFSPAEMWYDCTKAFHICVKELAEKYNRPAKGQFGKCLYQASYDVFMALEAIGFVYDD